MESSIWKAGIALTLTLITIVLFSIDVRYVVFSDNLFGNIDHQKGLSGWNVLGPIEDVSAGEQYVEIRGAGRPNKSGLRQSLTIPEHYEALLVEVDATTVELVTSKDRSAPGVFWVLCRNSSGESVRVSSVLPESPRGSAHYRNVMVLPEGVRTCTFEIYITKGTKGFIKLRDLGAFRVSQRDEWNVFYYTLLGFWVIVGLWVATSAIMSIERVGRRLHWTLAVCLVALSSLMSRPMQHTIRDWLFERYLQVSALAAEPTHSMVEGSELILSTGGFEGLVHVALFIFLSSVTRIVWPNRGLVLTIVYLGVVAASAEVIQLFPLDRHPRLTDWLLDIVGILLGLCIVELARMASRRVCDTTRI